MFVPQRVDQLAASAGIQGHRTVGRQGIGGSRVIQHWELSGGENQARTTLTGGQVDVFTMAAHLEIPDKGIENFVDLGLLNNPNLRLLVQASWVPFDATAPEQRIRDNSERDATDLAVLQTATDTWRGKLEAQVDDLNNRRRGQSVFIVPVGDAVNTLRRRVKAGEFPGVTKQADLFRDPIGHGLGQVQALAAYCNFAAIYGRSPVGLKLNEPGVTDDQTCDPPAHRLGRGVKVRSFRGQAIGTVMRDLSMNRRELFRGLAALACASAVRCRCAGGRPPRILLRSSWQTVNIGDIGHTPGVIRLLGEYLPEAEVTLWPSNVGDGVEEMLRRNFPKLRFAISPERGDARPSRSRDFLLHGSGASFVAQKHVARWRAETGKPYGIYGITLSSRGRPRPASSSTARGSSSSATRFRSSFARDQGLTCPVMEFGPDGAFGVNLRNDAAATAFLRASGLEDGDFLCVIPRLRYTPYWLIRHKPMTAEDHRKDARNEAMKEHDHAPLRAAIIAVARTTAMKVLVCPEDESQVAIGKAMLVDPLPDDVKAKVVWRDHYWLTDEALSTYVRSAGLFGLEMHSPIMCVANGVPAIVCRFQEQTSKGIMWRDIGLGDWLFDLDVDKDRNTITSAVLAIANDPAAARAKAEKAREFVHQRQRETMGVLRKELER